MSAGWKKIRQRIFLCPLTLLDNKRGFTIIEVLLVALIGTVIVTALFLLLNTGVAINDISSAKVLAQSQARIISDWVSRDLRQAVVWDLANNSPGPTHIKFRPVLGWDIAGNTYQLNADYIEYSYDANAHTLTRNLLNAGGAVLNTWVFTDVMTQPFFTRDSLGNLISLDNSVGTSKKVIVLISVRKISTKGIDLTVSLSTEIKIRNE